MKQVQTAEQIRKALASYKDQNKTIGFVPTMGALHDGHLALVDQSIKENDVTIVSIYINPTQFGPSEDFEQYPKQFEKDLLLLEKRQVDLVFMPNTETMYPNGNHFRIVEDRYSNVLCGAHRKNHFDGVCTIVSKFFHMVEPTHAYFGQKDAQQVKIIQSMAKDLFFPVQIKTVETVREKNGLAMSSRNHFLTPQEKEKAKIIFESLLQTKEKFESGENNTKILIEHCKRILTSEPDIQIQYVEILEWENFTAEETLTKKSVLAIACYFGSTRLIDNIIL